MAQSTHIFNNNTFHQKDIFLHTYCGFLTNLSEDQEAGLQRAMAVDFDHVDDIYIAFQYGGKHSENN